MMGDAADDAREQMEDLEILFSLHTIGQCEPDCPYCNYENEYMEDEENYTLLQRVERYK